MIDKITVPSAPIASSPNIQKTMKGNRSVNTVPEILLRKELFRIGFRYRVHYSLPGKPDIVFPSKKIAVFSAAVSAPNVCFMGKTSLSIVLGNPTTVNL